MTGFSRFNTFFLWNNLFSRMITFSKATATLQVLATASVSFLFFSSFLFFLFPQWIIIGVSFTKLEYAKCVLSGNGFLCFCIYTSRVHCIYLSKGKHAHTLKQCWAQCLHRQVGQWLWALEFSENGNYSLFLTILHSKIVHISK